MEQGKAVGFVGWSYPGEEPFAHVFALYIVRAVGRNKQLKYSEDSCARTHLRIARASLQCVRFRAFACIKRSLLEENSNSSKCRRGWFHPQLSGATICTNMTYAGNMYYTVRYARIWS